MAIHFWSGGAACGKIRIRACLSGVTPGNDVRTEALAAAQQLKAFGSVLLDGIAEAMP
jgi:hypothetical protein